jgi:hypothetical protein
MNKLLLIAITSFAFIGQAHAEKPDEIYKSCRLTGYFDGAKESLYADLANRISVAKGIKKDSTCDASYEAGISVGETVKKGAKLKNDPDNKIKSEASDFKKKIQESILKGAGLI